MEHQWDDGIASQLEDCGVEFNWFFWTGSGWSSTPKRCNRLRGHMGQHLWIKAEFVEA